MSRDKKRDDDDEDTPAAWAARQTRFSQASRALDHRQAEIRRRTEQEAHQQTQHYYRSGRSWRPTSQRPLVDRVTDDWRDIKHQLPPHDEWDPVARCCDPDDEASCRSVTVRMSESKRWRRLFLVLLALLACSIYIWRLFIWPQLEYDYELKIGFLRHPRGTFGLGAGGDANFAKEKIQQLDQALLPGGPGDKEGKRRLVFVGDVHGCKHELLELLKVIGFDTMTDHLVATGDLISQGPDSPGVLDELTRIKASSVRGNHEDRIITFTSLDTAKFGKPELVSKQSKKDSKLAKSLTSKHLEYLRDMPLILRIPPLPLSRTMGKSHKHVIRSEILVVHAGLVPAVPLLKQDPYFVMNMRSLAKKTHVPSIEPASKEQNLLPWTDSWNWYNARLAKGRWFKGWHQPDVGLEQDEPRSSWLDVLVSYFPERKQESIRPKAQVVVYGHDSRAGFTNNTWSKGLDSRCVAGGQLTAMVLDAYGRETYHSVDCKNYTEA